MDYRILGPLEVWDDQGALPLRGAKQRAVLAVLLLHANEVVSVDRLIDDVWGEEPPATATSALQVYISQLRKLLSRGGETFGALLTRSPGYELRVSEDELDAFRFERRRKEAKASLEEGDAQTASAKLHEALALWRGQPLADFAYEPFAQAEIERLEEARLAATEDRIEADLLLGRHDDVVGELESLVRRHPLRERLRGQLMLALYRAGRQAEALETYQEARRGLADELGIDPGPELQRLERAILTQDPELTARPHRGAAAPSPRRHLPSAERSILVVPRNTARMDALLSLAEPLALAEGNHDLLLARLVGPWEEPASGPDALAEATRELNELRSEMVDRGTPCRVVVFTSEDPSEDLARVAAEYPVDLLLVDGTVDLIQDQGSSDTFRRVLERVEQCDVAILLNGELGFPAGDDGGPIVVPFGGAEHDWPALQLASWIAAAHHTPIRLLGSTADLRSGQRDASRLLGRASLIVQEATGVVAEPVLVEPGPGILQEATRAGLVIMGLSEHWLQEGMGSLRTEISTAGGVPVILVRRGARSTSAVPAAEMTRFGWSRARSRASRGSDTPSGAERGAKPAAKGGIR